jgi:hypothetical protein
MTSPNEVEKPGLVASGLRALSKLGILRYGATAATYKSATDRPAELQMPDVLNADRDLTTADDLRAVVGADKTDDAKK